VLSVLLPLRHVAWGSNMNNSFICAYGYGTAITQPCLYAAMDQLGIAQYLSRLGLAFGDVDDLKRSKEAWLGAPAWQELRRYVEDTFVLKDWFELYVAQNVALDGILYPLIYDHFDADVVREAGSAVSMIVRFQEQWFSETSRWVDAMVKIAAAESPENKVALQEWLAHWLARARTALAPIATLALGAAGETALAASVETLEARLKKAGVLPA
jgi:phenol hydroxylase P1 protein